MSHIKARIERVYQYIVDCWEQDHAIPTQREIARDCELAGGTVSSVLSILEAQGRISRNPLKSRSIRLSKGTPKRDETAEDVYSYLKQAMGNGNIPSQAEIGETCYLSRGEVRRALDYLEGMGKIRREKGQRSIYLEK